MITPTLGRSGCLRERPVVERQAASIRTYYRMMLVRRPVLGPGAISMLPAELSIELYCTAVFT